MPDTTNPIEALFLKALEIRPAERAEFLLQECGGDDEKLRKVEELLVAHEQTGSFELDGQAAWAAVQSSDSGSFQIGQSIGPYKLLQEIGEGGMGVVFMADQKEPIKRRVALKIIKPGMDSKQVLARFEAERQALALMEHPNIAKVYEAGKTDTGLPYFVMELVKGVPITKFCDDNQMNAEKRLELFSDVCLAVQHAHQKGIIHRDLKPSNVLVAKFDDKPVVKVIDFGVAKATNQELTERTMFTQFGQIVGTLEYMSPEQAQFNQLDIDTRSDIYSLGVLLYEMLTGAPPFDRQRLKTAALDEILRILREEEPPRPSVRLSTLGNDADSISASRNTDVAKLGRLVRGDIDLIVMKAMEKERTRRYESASGLAADIKRFLTGEPIEARPASATYRVRRFVVKYRRAVLIVATILGTLTLALFAMTTLWIQANRNLTRVAQFAVQGVFEAALRGGDEQDLADTREIVSKAGLPRDELDAIEAAQALGEVDFEKAERLALGILGRSQDHVGAKAILPISRFWQGQLHVWQTDIVDVAKLNPQDDVDRLLLAFGLQLYSTGLPVKYLDDSSRVRSSPVRFMLRGLDRAEKGEDLQDDRFSRLALLDYDYAAEMMPKNLGVVAWRAGALSFLIELQRKQGNVEESLIDDARTTLAKLQPRSNPFLEYTKWRLLRAIGEQTAATQAVEKVGKHGWFSIFLLCDRLVRDVPIEDAISNFQELQSDTDGDIEKVVQAFFFSESPRLQTEVRQAAERLLKSKHSLAQLLALQALCTIEDISQIQARAKRLKLAEKSADRFGVVGCLQYLRDLDEGKAIASYSNSYALTQIHLTIGMSHLARANEENAIAEFEKCAEHVLPGNTNYELPTALLERNRLSPGFLSHRGAGKVNQ